MEKSMIGQKWNNEEENKLLNEIAQNLNLEIIAKNHNRTIGGIKSRIKHIATNMFENNISKNDIVKLTKLSEKDIDELLQKKNNYINLQNNIIKNDQIDFLSQKEEISLNEKQMYALELFKNKKNIFITGAGGTGKSTIIKEIIKYSTNNNIKIGVTATTGCAAILIGGKTLHSYLGIGLAEKSAKELYNHNKYHLSHIIKKLKELQVLIIDEVSMLDIALFEKISDYLSLIHYHKNPFGNLQIILIGDFCQLEPIKDKNSNDNYCFLSEVWTDLKLDIIFLDKMVRQKNDKIFQKILRELRYGICTDKTLEILKNCNKIINNNIQPTILYSRNIDVDKINKQEYDKLLKLNKKSYSYDIKLPDIKKNHDKIKNWIKSIDIPFTINFCIDAQVMITCNVNQNMNIINGTRGIVVDLLPDKILIKTIDNKIITINYHKCIYSEDNNMYFSYMPVKLAYAISIHKSQGTTLDAAEINIGKDIFAAGQAYTALSRVRDLNSIIIKDINKNSFIIKNSVLDFYSKIDSKLSI